MSRQTLDDASYVVPNGFGWGLTQTITLSASLQQVYFSGKNRVVMAVTDSLGASVVMGSSGATIAVQSQIVTVQSVCTAGANYAVGDSITLTGGTTTTAPILTVSAIGSTGGVTAVNITNAGVYAGTPNNPVGQGTTSGSGTGANFNISFGSNKRNIPPNAMHIFGVSSSQGIALVTLGTTTGGSVTISEAL